MAEKLEQYRDNAVCLSHLHIEPSTRLRVNDLLSHFFCLSAEDKTSYEHFVFSASAHPFHLRRDRAGRKMVKHPALSLGISEDQHHCELIKFISRLSLTFEVPNSQPGYDSATWQISFHGGLYYGGQTFTNRYEIHQELLLISDSNFLWNAHSIHKINNIQR